MSTEPLTRVARLTRRQLLGSLAALASVAALSGTLRWRTVSSSWLRPPGALPPGAFEAACIRCFRCAEVCPPQCITFHALLPPAEADTPFIDAAARACTLCMQCTVVCPTGALVHIEKKHDVIAALVRMGTPELHQDLCLAWNGQGQCHLCHDVCPYRNDAVSLLGDRLLPVFHADRCVGCGLCQEACPVDDKAIRIRPISSGNLDSEKKT